MSDEINNDKSKLKTNPDPFCKIDTFILGGFMAFKHIQFIPIRPITLIYGANSAGKSSILKGLRYALDSGKTDIVTFDNYINVQSIFPYVGFKFNLTMEGYLLEPEFLKRFSQEHYDDSKYISRRQLEGSSLFKLVGRMQTEILNPETLIPAIRLFDNIETMRKTQIEFDCGPKWNFKINVEIQIGDKVDLNKRRLVNNEEPVLINGNLKLIVENQKIILFESKFKNQLLSRIKDIYIKNGFSVREASLFLKYIDEEISKLDAFYIPNVGIGIESMSKNTKWHEKCVRMAKKNLKGIKDKNIAIDEMNEWIEDQAKYFNEFNHHMFGVDNFERMMNSRKSVDPKLFSANKIDCYSTVYSAVFGILFDINYYFANDLKLMSDRSKLKIKYIPAQREFLDGNGSVVPAWKWLIDGSDNRAMVNKWLLRLTTNFRISDPIKMYTENQAIQLQNRKYKIGDIGFEPILNSTLRIEDNRIDKRTFSPHEVGFGIQKLIPVVAASVSSITPELDYFNTKAFDIVAIEEPEMHLHPKLQSDIGDLFVENVINYSRKIFVIETHSENLLQRILRRIREGVISHDAVSVLYVHPGVGDEGARVERLEIDKEGEFKSPWPKGFFDTREDDILA